MTDRERLLNILSKPIFTHELVDPLEAVADYLLDNGVTFAKDTNVPSKWISVEDRVPEQYKSVIVWTRYGEMGEAQHDGKHFVWVDDDDYALATHWMPMPEPPRVQGVQNGTDHV